MGLREDRSFLKEIKESRTALKEAAAQQEADDMNNAWFERENTRLAHEAKIDNFYKYKDDVKKVLVEEALMNLYKNSFYHPTKRELAIGESLVKEYVEETGATKLLKNMKFSESGLLITIQEKVDEYFEKITDGAKAEDPLTQTIDPLDVDQFWKDIDNSEDIDDITSTIRLRVSNAEEKFVNDNQKDKENVKSILKDTASRVQSAKTSNDNEYASAVEESETRLAKDRIYQIQHEGNRSVFDRMVRNLSEVAITNPDAKKEFTNENGRLNLEKIVESARCMYTLLEMVGSLGIEKVDQAYIEDTLKSIK